MLKKKLRCQIDRDPMRLEEQRKEEIQISRIKYYQIKLYPLINIRIKIMKD